MSSFSDSGRLILCLALCAGAAGCSTAEPLPEQDLPHVLLLSFDTTRADLFGVLTGESPSLTPNLDAFAADAVVFENAFVQAPHTLPSHMSMMTSVYPDFHGVKPEQDPLPETLTTLPQILDAAGYRTAGFVTSEWLKPEFGFGRGFDEYELLPHRPTYADRVNAAALKSLAGAGPRFLFLHYYDLHSDFEQGSARNKLPYYSLPEDREGLEVSPDGSEFCTDAGECNTQYLMAVDRGRVDLPLSKIETIHDLYRAAMPELDRQMGAFFDALKERGVYDEALIVITSDHGEEFREHGRFIHSQPYDETARVPLFVKFPDSWMAATRVSAVAETVDILPTILDFLDLEIPEHVQGESLLPAITGLGTRTEDGTLTQDTIQQSRYGFRTARHKVIVDFKNDRRELYDLVADPGERANLATERPDLTKELASRLESLVRSNRVLNRAYARDVPKEGDVLSEEDREQLKALGYLD